MPPDPNPKLYSTKKTTIWFAVSGFILFAGLVAMVWQDSAREWKDWQRKYLAYNREKAQIELDKVKKAVDQEQLDKLKAEFEAAQEEIKLHKKEINQVNKGLNDQAVQYAKINAEYQELKQHQDSDRYFFEENRVHGDQKKAEYYRERLDKRGVELQETKRKLDELDKRKEELQKQLDEWTGKEKTVAKEMDRLTGEVKRVERKLEGFKPAWYKQFFLDAPMLDFIKPTLRIQQVVVENLYDDYYFKQVPKVDRCTTCHLGIDQPDLKDAPVPFQPHPNLDLFVSAESPHPMETFGCTTCHGGGGHSLTFETAAHTPETAEQAKEWEKKYHWKPMTHWTDKMLPLNHVEAACAKCHQGTVHVPKASKLNEGRRLMRVYGCTGCHKIQGFENQWKAGPDLRQVGTKLDADWIIRWLQDPKEFRPSTKMPKIFHLENTSDEESRDKNNATIAGIAAYLMKHSDRVVLEAPKTTGNPEKGAKLVEELGCLGCHSVGDKRVNDHGPELSGLGSKVKAEWLFTWLKDPKHYSENTRMPNLRLSDEEASDITSFLLTNRNEKFESLRAPHVKPETVDQIAMQFLTGKMREDEAKAQLNPMSPEARLEFIGEKSISHFGCFGCHDIKGFEKATPIGTELSQHGVKDVHRLDFGFVHIPHTRESWYFTKLKTPRIFDEGKVKPYHDKLKMPQFGFTDEQAEALTTFLLSLQDPKIPLEMKKQLNEIEKKVEAGRFFVEKLNCQGCHTVDGQEGAVRSLFKDAGNAPPVLDGEGKKVQPGWLYQFLEHPTVIRPWLKYRMPTFGFKEDEIAAVIEYFNGLSHVPPSFISNRIAPPSAEELGIGKKLFQDFQCVKCHKTNPDPTLTASFLAPNLAIAKERLRPDWVVDWMRDPQLLQEGTMMPSFFPDGQSPLPDIMNGDIERQIKAIRDYLWQYTGEESSSSAPLPSE